MRLPKGSPRSSAVLATGKEQRLIETRRMHAGCFAEKTACITGAGFAALKGGSAGSIGYGIAKAFAKEGANSAITGRSVAKLEAAEERLEGGFDVKFCRSGQTRTRKPTTRRSCRRPRIWLSAGSPAPTRSRQRGSPSRKSSLLLSLFLQLAGS